MGPWGRVIAIQTFGDYARWHPHVHVLLADGLFRESGVFYVMPKIDPAPLAELFWAKVLAMLKKEGRIDDALIAKLLTWRHNSGFSVHNGVRLARDDEAGREERANRQDTASAPQSAPPAEVEVLDLSDYRPRKIPSLS